MITIAASLRPQSVSELLCLRGIENLGSFRNFDTTDELFDHLWDESSNADFVIIDNLDIDEEDLKFSCLQMAKARLILIGVRVQGADNWPTNVSFIKSADTLKRTVEL